MASIGHEQWQAAKEIFYAALQRSPAEREQFLNDSCKGDEPLRAEVESLLRSHEQAQDFMQRPAVGEVADVVVKAKHKRLVNGQTVAQYKIVSQLGIGGQGAVYKALDTRLGRTAALKLLPPELTFDGNRLKRFQREAQLASSLEHPNICTIYDLLEVEGNHPIAMQFVAGKNVRQLVGHEPLELKTALKIAIQVCDALAAAHARGIIHRDIKAQNVIVTESTQVKLLDFGLAKLTSDSAREQVELTTLGTPYGTHGYAAPEQERGERADHRADVFSVGVLLYEMLAGMPPFRGKSTVDISHAVLYDQPKPVAEVRGEAIPQNLQQITDRALAKDPKQRYQQIAEMRDDLVGVLRALPAGEDGDTASFLDTFAPRRIRSSMKRRVAYAAAIVLLLAATALVYRFLGASARQSSNEQVTSQSIAVLPFEYLGANKSDAYLSDGIQEEILTRLSKIADLKVISRTSTQRYKSKPENLPTIAKQLGVAHILEGSVQKSGDAVRVNVQLINAQNDSHLWAENYDRKVNDIFAVESDIATRIANTLQAKLTGSEQRAIAARPTENPEAYQLYLKGRYFWSKRTEEDLLRAIDYFNQAIAKDPNYARAYSGIADCYIVLPFFSKLSPSECSQKAKLAANKALEIDNGLAEAHVSLGVLLMGDLKISEAKREFLHAIDLDPNYANAHNWYANNVLVPLGQFDDVIAEFKRALELDPLSAPINANFGYAYAMGRRYSDAARQLQKTIELDPNFSYAHGLLGYTFDLSGQFDQAIREYQKAYDLSHDFHVLYPLGHAYGLKGDREKAFQVLKQLQDFERQNLVFNFGFALVYLGLGDKNEALNRLEQSYRTGEGKISYIKVDPMFDPLRGDPRFERLVQKVFAPKQ